MPAICCCCSQVLLFSRCRDTSNARLWRQYLLADSIISPVPMSPSMSSRRPISTAAPPSPVVAGTAMAFQSDGTNYHFVVRSAPGIGTVTSLTGTCGILHLANPFARMLDRHSAVSPQPSLPLPIRRSRLVIAAASSILNNGSDQMPTIGQAGSAGFPAGWSTTSVQYRRRHPSSHPDRRHYRRPHQLYAAGRQHPRRRSASG